MVVVLARYGRQKYICKNCERLFRFLHKTAISRPDRSASDPSTWRARGVRRLAVMGCVVEDEINPLPSPWQTTADAAAKDRTE
jgi:transposase-like protein